MFVLFYNAENCDQGDSIVEPVSFVFSGSISSNRPLSYGHSIANTSKFTQQCNVVPDLVY